MSLFYHTVVYRRDLRCPSCRALLGKQYRSSDVYERNGEPYTSSGMPIGKSIYEMRCECGTSIDLHDGQDVSSYRSSKEPGEAECAPVVLVHAELL